MKVDIAIITYKRPASLKRLLQGIANLGFAKVSRPDLRIIVVDNDELKSAMNICADFAKDSFVRIDYIVEPKRGISQARNTAISHARDDTDYVAFIDDDEFPEPTWLDELLSVALKYEADIVTGPVKPYFMDQPAPWIKKGKFYERPRHPTGQLIDYARTGNALVSCRVFHAFKRENIPFFDERFSLIGGEDALFFKRAVQLKFKIVWADEAVVHEFQPATRVSLKWILLRALRTAQSEVYIAYVMNAPFLATAKGLIFGLLRIVIGSVLLLPSSIYGIVKGKHLTVKILRIIARGIGMILASLGIHYVEYKNPHPLEKINEQV